MLGGSPIRAGSGGGPCGGGGCRGRRQQRRQGGGGGLAWPGLSGRGRRRSSTMSLQYGAEETPLAGSYGAADSFPKDFGYGVEEEEEEAAAGGGGGAGAGGGCGPGGADSSKPRILLMGLRRSGKSSIQKVSVPRRGPRPRSRSARGAQVAASREAREGGGLAPRPGAPSTPASAELRRDPSPRVPDLALHVRLCPPRAERAEEATLAGGWRQVPGTALDLRPLGRSPRGVEETDLSSPVLTWRTW